MGKALVIGAAWVSLALAGTLVAEEPAKKDDAPRNELLGKWAFTKIVRYGAEPPPEFLRTQTVFITASKISIKSDEGEHSAAYTVDLTKTPATIDITPDGGDDAGKARPGILELKNGVLRICFAREGKPRPTAFASKEEDKTVLYELKRDSK